MPVRLGVVKYVFPPRPTAVPNVAGGVGPATPKLAVPTAVAVRPLPLASAAVVEPAGSLNAQLAVTAARACEAASTATTRMGALKRYCCAHLRKRPQPVPWPETGDCLAIFAMYTSISDIETERNSRKP